MSIEKEIGILFFKFLYINQKKIETCNDIQMDQPITANEPWSTRRLNKYDWLAIS